MFPIAGACAEFSCRPEIRGVALLPFLYSVILYSDECKTEKAFQYFERMLPTFRAVVNWRVAFDSCVAICHGL